MKLRVLALIAIIALSIIPSMYIAQKTSINDLGVCSDMLGVNKGNCYLEQYGYPVNHSVNLVAYPTTNDAGYESSAYELKQFNMLNVLISVVFWSSLLAIILNIVTNILIKDAGIKKPKKSKK